MADVPLKVVITADSAAIKKALKGVQKEVAKGEKAAQKALKKTDQMRSRSMQRQKMDAKQLGSTLSRVSSKTQRELTKSIHTGVKNGVKKARAFLKSNRGNLAGMMGLGAAGALAGAHMLRSARGFSRTPLPEASFETAEKMKQQLFFLGEETGKSRVAMENIEKRMMEVSRKYAIDPAVVVGAGLEVQQRLSAKGFEDFMNNLDVYGEAMAGRGAELDVVAVAAGEFGRQFKVAGEDFPKLVGFLVEAVTEGSVEINSLSKEGVEAMAALAANFRRSGDDAAKEMVAIFEAVGEQVPDPSVVKTSVQQYAMMLMDPKFRKRLRDSGSKTRVVENGEVRNAYDIARDFATDPLFQGDAGIQRFNQVFNDKRSRKAINAMIADVREELEGGQPSVLRTIQEMGGEEGLKDINAAFGRRQQEPEFMLRKQRVDAIVNVFDQFDGIAEVAYKTSGALDELRSRFVILDKVLQGVGVAAAGLLGFGALSSVVAGTGAGGILAATPGATLVGKGLLGVAGGAGVTAALAAPHAVGEVGAQAGRALGETLARNRMERTVKNLDETTRRLNSASGNLDRSTAANSTGRQEGGP